MVIERNKKNCASFGELSAGDVFEYYGDVYIKLAGDGINGENAVRLDNGSWNSLFESTPVLALNARLVLD